MIIPIKTTCEENHSSRNGQNTVGLSVINHASTIYMNKFNKMLVLTANTADIFQRVIFETKNTCFCHYIKYADNQCDRLF